MDTTHADIEVGAELGAREFTIDRPTLIRYCGASSDFTGIHWNERIATSVDLPNVIAHGALTVAMALRVVTDWAGDPSAVRSYKVRFSNPVVVPDDDRGATVRVSGVVVQALPDDEVLVELRVHSGDDQVLTGMRVAVRPPRRVAEG